MGIEIERKFLLDHSKLPELTNGLHIKQGYIPTEDLTVVRIRYTDETSYLTIKGKTEGFSRAEYEYPIPNEEADTMLETLCAKPFIDKTRYKIKHDAHTWEVDVFHGLNEGLIVAEVEMASEDEKVTLPSWVRTEVTDDIRYLNSNLCDNPFTTW